MSLLSMIMTELMTEQNDETDDRTARTDGQKRKLTKLPCLLRIEMVIAINVKH